MQEVHNYAGSALRPGPNDNAATSGTSQRWNFDPLGGKIAANSEASLAFASGLALAVIAQCDDQASCATGSNKNRQHSAGSAAAATSRTGHLTAEVAW